MVDKMVDRRPAHVEVVECGYYAGELADNGQDKNR